MAHLARPARSDDGDIDGLRGGARQLQIIPFLGAVAVHAREEHFARAQFFRLLDPLNGVEIGLDPAAVEIDVPSALFVALGVYGKNDALPPELQGCLRDERGIFDGGGIDRDLIRPAREHSSEIFRRADAAPHREG